MIICPICQNKLTLTEKQGICDQGHLFDRSRQGYINLSLKQSKGHGDNQLLSHARDIFLNGGFYEFLSQKIIEILKQYPHQFLLDLGCGQGYYLKQFVSALKPTQSVGIDLSKDSLKIASRNDKQSTYIVATSAFLPIQNESVDVVLNMFSPKVEKEVYRVLKPKGIWIGVDVAKNHLLQLKEMLYEQVVLNDETPESFNDFTLLHQEIIQQEKIVKQPYLSALLDMTPYRFTSPLDKIQQVYQQTQTPMCFSFNIKVYQK